MHLLLDSLSILKLGPSSHLLPFLGEYGKTNVEEAVTAIGISCTPALMGQRQTMFARR